MKQQTCSICDIIKTPSPDMCDYCHASINTLDYIQRMLYNFKDARKGAAIAKMIEDLCLVVRDDITKKIKEIRYVKGENGERMPGFMHAPYFSRYTKKYATVGGLMAFVADMVSYHDKAVPSDRDEFLRLTLMHAMPHAMSSYQYLDANASERAFKIMPGRIISGQDTIVQMSKSGVDVFASDLPLLLGEDDRVVGMATNVMAGILTVTRTA